MLARCEALRRATGGYFDVRATGALDPSGFVKGWAVDRAARCSTPRACARWCVDAGGDVLVRGGGWRVGVRHPASRARSPAWWSSTTARSPPRAPTSAGPTCATRTRARAPAGVRSVTVLGRELATADAYATAAFAMGERGPAWTARLRGHGAMTILAGDRVLATPAFLARCPGGSLAASLSGG